MPTTYCSKCVLHASHPGIKIHDQGKCSVCSGEHSSNWLQNYEQIVENNQKYLAFPGGSEHYDAVLLLSGGKDSIYMLWKTYQEQQKKILVFTYNHPFESENSKQNIENLLNKLDIHHIRLSSFHRFYKLMNVIFTQVKPGNRFQSEFIPCKLCSSYLTLQGVLLAVRMRIPFVLYCADPVQILGSETYSNVKRMISLLMEYIDAETLRYVFDYPIDSLLEKKETDLPSLVFPYIDTINEYNKDTIIAELKSADLYKTSSIRTSCSIHPLLEYYAFKNFECSAISMELAALVRKGDLPREDALKTIEETRRIYFELLQKESLTDEDNDQIYAFLHTQFPDSPEDAEYLHALILKAKETAQRIGFTL